MASPKPTRSAPSKAKTSSRAKSGPPVRPVPPARVAAADLTGIAFITAGVLLAVSLYSAQAGPVIGWLRDGLAWIVGRLVVVVPLLLVYLGGRTIWRREQLHPNRATVPSLVLLTLAVSAMLAQRVPVGQEFAAGVDGLGWLYAPAQHGGLLGIAQVWALRHVVGGVGTPIVLAMVCFAGLVMLSEHTMREMLLWLGRSTQRQARAVQRAAKAQVEQRRQTHGQARLRPSNARNSRWRPLIRDLSFPDPSEGGLPPADLIAPTEATPAAAPAVLPGADPTAVARPAEPAARPASAGPALPAEPLKVAPVAPPDDANWKQQTLPGMPKVDAKKGADAAFPVPDAKLIEPPPAAPLPDRGPEIEANSRRLEGTMASFGIEARVVNTEIGPTITRYEMELGPGIRVSKVAGMADDIALALASAGIRIEAPVPGKGVIGIEVPNQIRETVDLHPLLNSPAFTKAKGGLPFVIGKDIAGHVKVGDLARMPHMLVAGTTNSGKSVCLNCVIISLIYRLSPRDLRFLMVDPKRVELTLYDGIPHLDRPVVTDPDDAADLLRGAVREMYARYDRLSEQGVRNIVTYNEQVGEDERMPYLVIIIDELAELMMTARAEVEASIVRLAQLARAVGIHLVLATQRPAVNVVTGQIKANIPTRCAFRVPQLVDSRVILDDKGAERLIGRGDMLFASEETGGKPERLQGAFVGEAQVHKLVAWLNKLPSSLTLRYADSIIQPLAAEDADGGSGESEVDDSDLDELFWQCVNLVRSEGEASTSRLQRTFGIGYNRAGRIMDQMHAMGIVGPPRGSKPRELLAGGPTDPNERRVSSKPEPVAEPAAEPIDGP